MLSGFVQSFIVLSDIMLRDAMPCVITLSAILLSVIVPNDIIPIVIILSIIISMVVILSVIVPSVVFMGVIVPIVVNVSVIVLESWRLGKSWQQPLPFPPLKFFREFSTQPPQKNNSIIHLGV